jgi:hypothetical protein
VSKANALLIAVASCLACISLLQAAQQDRIALRTEQAKATYKVDEWEQAHPTNAQRVLRMDVSSIASNVTHVGDRREVSYREERQLVDVLPEHGSGRVMTKIVTLETRRQAHELLMRTVGNAAYEGFYKETPELGDRGFVGKVEGSVVGCAFFCENVYVEMTVLKGTPGLTALARKIARAVVPADDHRRNGVTDTTPSLGPPDRPSR